MGAVLRPGQEIAIYYKGEAEAAQVIGALEDYIFCFNYETYTPVVIVRKDDIWTMTDLDDGQVIKDVQILLGTKL